MTTAYKFLRPGRIAPFTCAAWPEPGRWMETGAETELCRSGIHALAAEALPRWMTEELWRVELDGIDRHRDGILLARRGRLLDRVTDWDDGAAAAYAADIVEHLPATGSALARARAAAVVDASAKVRAGTTAVEIGYMAGMAWEAVEQGGYDRERRREATWLARRLQLS